MRTMALATVAAAAAVALSLFDAAPADAQFNPKSFKAPVRSVPRSLKMKPTFTKKAIVKTPKTIGKVPKTIGKLPSKTITKVPTKTITKLPAKSFVKKATLGKGTVNLKALPHYKPVASKGLLKGKLPVPKNIQPKLKLAHFPHKKHHHHFAPFIQRPWKSAFFWVAVAGIGYLTIPALYYDRFYTCMDVDDPVYDDCLYILDEAALEEEEVVRISMPAQATYRYRASAPAKQECPACRWDRFVERRWNQSYSWVKLPDIGNVTVPDTYYDRFFKFAGANPPNYPQACQVLQEAAAGEAGEVERVSMPSGAGYRFEAEAAPAQECKSCTFEPFVDRKWNREFVWVEIPQTGNVTVPEDSYDSFYRYASADPPDYKAACKVLVEAAAADTVQTTALDNRRGLE